MEEPVSKWNAHTVLNYRNLGEVWMLIQKSKRDTLVENCPDAGEFGQDIGDPEHF